MKIEDLLEECEYAYFKDDFKKLLKLCGEVLKIDPANQIAIGYKSCAYCFLNQPEKTVEILDDAMRKYPRNYYFKNNIAMAYYDLGDFEKSLRYCNEGLKIKGFDWLYINKIKALLKLDRIDEAVECFENAPYNIEILDLFFETQKYSEALKYSIDAEVEDFESVVDIIKEADKTAVGEYYMSWIYKIRYTSDIRSCPDCGGELIPIVYGLPCERLLEESLRGEIYLGGCELSNFNYHCKSCGGEFDLGFKGLHIECDDFYLAEYIWYKIDELILNLKNDRAVFVRPLGELKSDLGGFDDEEFDAFIAHLTDLGYISIPHEGYVKITGYDDLKCVKAYPEEGKFAAPRWLAFPQYSIGTMGWRMGAGENYAMNEPRHTDEFKKLFPMPEYWKFYINNMADKPLPPLCHFWRKGGKPKFPYVKGGVEVNDFITLSDEKKFTSDTFTFSSIEEALSVSKHLYLERYPQNDWDEFAYTVLLNAAYFKIMQDEDLKRKLLETGDKALAYISHDSENLFGRALMEIRDEIRRICENEDRIDWEFTDYLKVKPWM